MFNNWHLEEVSKFNMTVALLSWQEQICTWGIPYFRNPAVNTYPGPKIAHVDSPYHHNWIMRTYF